MPSFSVVLNLIGASATAIASFIVPPLLYLRLTSMEGDWPERYVSEFAALNSGCGKVMFSQASLNPAVHMGREGKVSQVLLAAAFISGERAGTG